MEKQNDYFFNPWESDFIEHVKKVERSIDIICPFIKLPIVKKILISLPDNKDIHINILSRFTKQVFIQGSSDLSVFDLLINHASAKYKIAVYNLSRLHAKIYIFDGKDMFLTSSNLSFSGLNKNYEIAVKITNQNEISEVFDTVSSLFVQNKLITDEDVQEMSETLNARAGQLIESGDIEHLILEPFDDEIEDMPESEIFMQIDEVEESIDIDESKKEFVLLEEINKFITQRGVALFNQIEGIAFESTKRPKVNRDDIPEEELIKFQNHWNEKALDDEKMLEKHICKIFGKILNADLEKAKLLKHAFIHRSWLLVYKNENFYTFEFYAGLGKRLLQFLITKSLSEKKLFSDNKIAEYAINKNYIYLNYPSEAILSSINCRIVLHLGALDKQFDREILDALMGILVSNIPYDKFYNIFKRLLDRTSDFVYENYAEFDYKTRLQEIAQSISGLPKYKVVGESGLEHEKLFEVVVLLEGQEIGRGSGESIKEAQKEAAFNGIKHLYKEGSYVEGNDTSHRLMLTKYTISGSRVKELIKFRDNLPFHIENLRLLDIALTHTSYINSNRSCRSNLKLSLYGANLENFIRYFIYSIKSKGLISKETINNVKTLLSVSPVKIFSLWFDKNKLEQYLKIVNQGEVVPDSVKANTVQAVIATLFIDQGFDETVIFLAALWKDEILKIDAGKIVDTVTEVQKNVQAYYIGQQASEYIEYKIIRQTPLPGNKIEFELACLIEGYEYGRGVGSKKAAAKKKAAEQVLNSKEFKEKYL